MKIDGAGLTPQDFKVGDEVMSKINPNNNNPWIGTVVNYSDFSSGYNVPDPEQYVWVIWKNNTSIGGGYFSKSLYLLKEPEKQETVVPVKPYDYASMFMSSHKRTPNDYL